MTKVKNIILGLILIAVGVFVALNVFDVIDVDILFDGWWTLFIIIPSFLGLFDKGEKTGNIIGLLIGIGLLLSCQNVIDFDILWKLALPTLLVIIGLSIIFKNTTDKKTNERISELKKNTSDTKGKHDCCAFFSGQDINFSGEQFSGGRFSAIFGGIECDLRTAIIENDVLINADAIFGGIDIIAPSNVKVKVKSVSIFGGSSNKAIFTGNENSPTIYVNSTCIFGGLDVK